MKPIEYFSLFEEAKNNFVTASKKKDFLGKMTAAKDIMKAGHQIFRNNWHTALKKLFVSESNKNKLPEAREMYTTLVPLIDVTTEGLKVANMYYEVFYQPFTEAVDIMNSVAESKKTDDAELKDLVAELYKTMQDQYERPLKGVDCIVNGMYIPLSVIVGIVRDFAPDHFLIKEEQIVISQN
jgi:hypothetical protein